MARITKSTDTVDSSAPLPPNGKTVLIAEDDPFISRMYETKLTTAGYKVLVENNGRDAFESIKKNHPNLMMLDINMPELSGFEVLSALQNEGYDFASSPAIILTNSSETEHRQLADKLGADYMIKAEMTPRQVLDEINLKLGLGPAKESAPTPPKTGV